MPGSPGSISACLAGPSCPSKGTCNVGHWVCQLLPGLRLLCPTFSPAMSQDISILKSSNTIQVQSADWLGQGSSGRSYSRVSTPWIPTVVSLLLSQSYGWPYQPRQLEVCACRPFRLFIIMFKTHSKVLTVCCYLLKMVLGKWMDCRRGITGACLFCFLSNFLWFLMNIPYCLPRTLNYEYKWRWN